MINQRIILGEPRRQRILKLVWDNDLSAGEIANDLSEISFGAVSQHLGILVNGGLVTVRKEGRKRIYRANRADMGALEAYLNEYWGDKLRNLKSKAEAIERKKQEQKK